MRVRVCAATEFRAAIKTAPPAGPRKRKNRFFGFGAVHRLRARARGLNATSRKVSARAAHTRAAAAASVYGLF